jgi:outer membrane autotransporter protein
MNSGSTYLQDIAGKLQASAATPLGSTGYYSFLNVNVASLVINPGATLSPRLQNLFSANEPGYGSAPYVPLLGDRFTIAKAQGGISGKFTSVTQPAGLTTGTQFIPFYNIAGNNSLELAVIPTSYTVTLAKTNANTRSVAGALDQLSAATQIDAASTSQLALMYATASQTASSLASFTQSLAGEIYGATIAVVAQTTQRVQSAVLSRLADRFSLPTIQNGLSPETSILVTPQNPAGIPGSNVSSNPDVNPRATPSNSSLARGNVWGEIAYQYGNRAGDDKASGFSSNLYQMVLGVDGYKEHGITAGGGIALSNTNISANLGSGTVQQGSLFLYGKLPVESFMFDVMASYGLNATDNSRADPLSNGSLQAKGVRGNDALLSAGLSRAFETESARITPYIRMTWQQVNQSSFGEGSSPAALNVNSFSGNGLRGVLGLTLSGKELDPMKASYTYRANLGVGADTNTLINPTLNATLAGFGTTIQTANVGSTFVQAGLYGTAKFADNAYAYAGITGETRSGQTLGAVSLGVRIQF